MAAQNSKSKCPRKQGRSCLAFMTHHKGLHLPYSIEKQSQGHPDSGREELNLPLDHTDTRSHCTGACGMGDVVQLSLENIICTCKRVQNCGSLKYLNPWSAVTQFLWNDYRWNVICLNNSDLKLSFIIAIYYPSNKISQFSRVGGSVCLFSKFEIFVFPKSVAICVYQQKVWKPQVLSDTYNNDRGKKCSIFSPLKVLMYKGTIRVHCTVCGLYHSISF